MGIEYEHWFFVQDLTWTGDKATIERIHRVLLDWNLVTGKPVIWDLAGGGKKRVTRSLMNVAQVPENLRLDYPEVFGVPEVEKIMGPSWYPEDQIGERYFQGVSLVVGLDFNLVNWTEVASVEVLEPPHLKGKAVAPYPDNWKMGYLEGEKYPGTAHTEPPRAELVLDRPWPAPPDFAGVWRSGLALDCGKDCPAVMERDHRVPGRAFVQQLADAFGTELVEMGRSY